MPADNDSYINYKLSQHDFKRANDAIAYTRLYEASDDRTRGILNARSLNNSSLWMLAIPSEWNGQAMDSTGFKSALKFNTCHPFTAPPVNCCQCKNTVVQLDSYGDHAVSCPCTGDRIGKHNAIIGILSRALTKARITHSKEVRVDRTVMGDIVIDCWINDTPLYIDVSIVNPVAPSYIRSAQVKEGAITRREIEKRTKYSEQINGPNAKLFQPVVCETFGGWKKESIMLFKLIAEKIAERKFTDVKTEFKILMTGLSFSLQKYNARMIKTRMYAY